MVESLCSSYHISPLEVVKLTVPQIIMMNHAAHVNYERQEKMRERGKQEDRNPVQADGKRVEQMSTDQLNFGLMSFIKAANKPE